MSPRTAPPLYVSPIKSFKSPLATWLCLDPRLRRGWPLSPEPGEDASTHGAACCSKSSGFFLQLLQAAHPALWVPRTSLSWKQIQGRARQVPAATTVNL